MNKVMKANAPKKIYLTKNLLGELSDGWNAFPSETFTNIEYTRTDAFIKKTCAWLKNNLQGIVGGSIYIEDFRKYMKGE